MRENKREILGAGGRESRGTVAQTLMRSCWAAKHEKQLQAPLVLCLYPSASVILVRRVSWCSSATRTKQSRASYLFLLMAAWVGPAKPVGAKGASPAVGVDHEEELLDLVAQVR